MADGSHDGNCRAGAVPVAQLLRTRADFPDRRLTYEVQLAGLGWHGIAALASACAAAGLQLMSLRCAGNGQAFCALCDDGTADLDRLSAGLCGTAQITGWTTLILY